MNSGPVEYRRRLADKLGPAPRPRVPWAGALALMAICMTVGGAITQASSHIWADPDGMDRIAAQAAARESGTIVLTAVKRRLPDEPIPHALVELPMPSATILAARAEPGPRDPVDARPVLPSVVADAEAALAETVLSEAPLTDDLIEVVEGPALPAAIAEPAAPVPEVQVAALEPTAMLAGPAPFANPDWRGGPPRLAIIIDDLGLSPRNTDAAIALPVPVTLAFLPYGRLVRPLARQGVEAGHEVILHLPMQPMGTADPGPNALLSDLDTEEFDRRIDWAFDQFDGYAGFNNHMGSLLTQDRVLMDRIMARVQDKGLYFIDSLTTAASRAGEAAREAGLPALKRHVFLDHEITRSYVVKQLARMERIAKLEGAAIAIGHPHDVTLAALARWIPQAEARGFTFVTASALLAPSPVEPETPAEPDGPSLVAVNYIAGASQ